MSIVGTDSVIAGKPESGGVPLRSRRSTQATPYRDGH